MHEECKFCQEHCQKIVPGNLSRLHQVLTAEIVFLLGTKDASKDEEVE